MHKSQLIVALDVANRAEMKDRLARLPRTLSWFKVGLELFCAEGPAVLDPLRERNASIFLDLKLHDIPRTVERAVKSAGRHSVHLLTIHASGGSAMVRAAAEAAKSLGPSAPKIIAVTALTSLAQSDLDDLGIARKMTEQVLALARLAIESGADGLVCSPLEAALLRRALGPAPLLVTPGIRATGEEKGDQQRTLTAGEAVRAGATHLVVGRPILEAPDPHEAALRLLDEIRAASS